MDELAARMAAGVARVPGRHGDPGAARGRLRAIGTAYLAFAREEPGLFATAFALPQQHAYGVPDARTDPNRTGPDRTDPDRADPDRADPDRTDPDRAHPGRTDPDRADPDPIGPDRSPLGQLRAALDELADAGLLDRSRRDGIEYPIWATVHGLAVLAGSGPLRDVPAAARQHLDELTLGFIQDALARDGGVTR
jgi:hypothetical protein